MEAHFFPELHEWRTVSHTLELLLWVVWISESGWLASLSK